MVSPIHCRSKLACGVVALRSTHRQRAAAAVALAMLLATVGILELESPARAETLRDRLSQTRERIEASERRGGVLSSTIARRRSRARELRAGVAQLRARDAALVRELAETDARLRGARERRRSAEVELVRVRDRLAGATRRLRGLLVSIYRSGQPDILTVILESEGFDELLSRSEYASRLSEYRSAVIARVRSLKARVARSVAALRDAEAEIVSARAAITDRRRRLASVKGELESRRRSLVAAVDRERQTLAAVGEQRSRLERVESRLQDRIQAELAATATPVAAAGPQPPQGADSSVSAAGLIWPLQGPLTSPFGSRWGRLHAGIDIAAPGGTPIRAAASGSVAIAALNGGYGNYTCINHAGGLSTCYAHQSAFATSAGSSVEQGEVIGYVGNTGNSFGDHLHFEVRTNGVPQDPLDYL